MNSSESTTKPSQLKKGKFKMNEYEVILKSLQATIGKETIRKILEQFKEIAKNNNLDRSNNLLHSVYQIEISNTIKESVLSGNKALKTSKSDTKNHGIGIKSVKSRAEKYNGKTEFTEENGQFVARVWLMA